jgi:hypothetical protein
MGAYATAGSDTRRPRQARARAGGGLPRLARVLAVCAHPDDESFGLGAVLAAFTGAGAESSMLCFTHGEASTLQLAFGDIFGGNAFLPVLFLLASLLSGQAVVPRANVSDIYLTGLGALLTVVYVFGIVFRPPGRSAGSASTRRLSSSSICWASPASSPSRPRDDHRQQRRAGAGLPGNVAGQRSG